jgi:GNAT superfamily N-acetyltransferase
MTELREATASEAAVWQAGWKDRLGRWYDHPDVPAEFVTSTVARRLAMQLENDRGSVLSVVSDGTVIGAVAAALFDDESGASAAMLTDVYITPDRRRHGLGAEAVRLTGAWAREHGAAAMWLLTDPGQPAHAALFARYPVRAQQMIRKLPRSSELAAGVSARPMTSGEFDGWRAKAVAEYATEMAESGSISAEAAAAASSGQFDQLLPGGLGTENHTFICLEAGGQVVATNWIFHHRWPGVSWVYGVEVSEGQRGKGYGRAAMVAGEQSTTAAGDTHLALNVFGQNAVAIGMYEAMGYRCYDQGRSAEL